MSCIQQRTFRYAYLLWEFWKKDSELFPKEILAQSGPDLKPHALVFVFDGSPDKIISNEEAEFYKNVLQKVRAKSKILFEEERYNYV